MLCSHFEAGRCGSCTLLRIPYLQQVGDKQRHCAQLLADFEPEWLTPVLSDQMGFRNKAKMVVTGTAQNPVLGIFDSEYRGIDLHDCPLYSDKMQQLLKKIAEFISAAKVVPYDVLTQHGELKYVLVTQSPQDLFMIRFVTRSQEPVTRIKKALPAFLVANGHVRVVSVNVQPEHKAVLEGALEILLTDDQTLPMAIASEQGTTAARPITLHLRPQSFFQTNTSVAAQMYHQAQDWVQEVRPDTVWDLFCGVGGFALHVAPFANHVIGIEISEQAIESAELSAAELDYQHVTFGAGDATAFSVGDQSQPDLVIVNPPRRGIGQELATWLEYSKANTVIYSSCNAKSLAKDLAVMPSLEPVAARILDMFPNTSHYEVMVLLKRARSSPHP